ncbi:MAG TPA: glucose-1-phosphate cytidylyltransferase [bacterium]|nr:glucose-1-phosphate cytidylyltransferase [bacterium]
MKPKVVILCGGRGTRMKEETEFRPKPLVEVGGKPILWHIMKIYAHFGFDDFVLCLGYKGNMIKEYFLNYEIMNSDFTMKLGSNSIKAYDKSHEQNWQITFADTGEKAQTGTRVKRIEKYIDGDLFMLTYGDGVADIDIKKVLEFHKSHGKIGTITGVHPSSRFGELVIKKDHVVEFGEKPQTKEGFINGGFFVFNKEFFSYLKDDDNCYMEKEPLENLVRDNELKVYLHRGFWQCMDTQRELDILSGLWASGRSPWKVWK